MLTTEQIITYLQLPKIGNVATFSLCNNIANTGVTLDNLSDMLDYLNMCISKNIITRTAKEGYDITDLEEAESKAKNIIRKSFDNGIKIASYYDPTFPEKLKNITDEKGKSSNPLLIYYKGNISALPNRGIAIIGTREPTPEGIAAGEFFGEQFAKRGYNIVSGLALGCDASGHRGALKGNGFTTAFLAHGLDMIYPKENKSLAQEIVENGGLLISEYPTGTQPMANYFVTRDRLQSGMADATLVVQTGVKGGTMHAVNATIAANKFLFAVNYKGNVNTMAKVQGNVMLIDEKKALPLMSNNLFEVIEKIENLKSSLFD